MKFQITVSADSTADLKSNLQALIDGLSGSAATPAPSTTTATATTAAGKPIKALEGVKKADKAAEKAAEVKPEPETTTEQDVTTGEASVGIADDLKPDDVKAKIVEYAKATQGKGGKADDVAKRAASIYASFKTADGKTPSKFPEVQASDYAAVLKLLEDKTATENGESASDDI